MVIPLFYSLTSCLENPIYSLFKKQTVEIHKEEAGKYKVALKKISSMEIIFSWIEHITLKKLMKSKNVIRARELN